MVMLLELILLGAAATAAVLDIVLRLVFVAAIPGKKQCREDSCKYRIYCPNSLMEGHLDIIWGSNKKDKQTALLITFR